MKFTLHASANILSIPLLHNTNGDESSRGTLGSILEFGSLRLHSKLTEVPRFRFGYGLTHLTSEVENIKVDVQMETINYNMKVTVQSNANSHTNHVVEGSAP